ncbi:MAG: hypothetical protein AAF067_06850, partial [Pseudomonadota bacterium]
ASAGRDETATRRLKLAKYIWVCNQKRQELIPGFGWGEMPWDMLLSAYISGAAKPDDGKIAINDNAQLSSDVAQRYLDILSDNGLVDKETAAAGTEPQLPRLTAKGLTAIENWLDYCAKGMF